MKHGSLFSGIGGFDLAAEWMGWDNLFHCEQDEFCRTILNYYWPKAKTYADIKETDFTIWRNRIDILTGGFPCQPYSQAGKRLGTEDERHLWPEMLRAIREITPSYIVGENVAGIVNWNGGLVFEEICSDLEAEGYEVQPVILPAAGVNAPHRRDRVWFIAYTQGVSCSYGTRNAGSGTQKIQEKRPNESINVTDTEGGCKQGELQSRQKQGESRRFYSATLSNQWQNFPTQPPVCSRDDGISSELDGITFPKRRKESIKGYGNAIVPQVAHEIFKAIEQHEKQQTLFK